MTLALATSPAIAKGGYSGATPASLASNTFSPPAGSVIFCTAMASFGAGSGATPAATITDSLGSHLTWNKIAEQNVSAGYATTVVWWAYTASSQTSMTVTPTITAASGGYVGSLDVVIKVFTGANTSGPAGTVIKGSYTASSTLSESLTPQAAGSALFMAANDVPSSLTTYTWSAGTGCYLEDVDNAPAGFGSLCQVMYGTSSGPTLTPNTSAVSLIATTTDTSPVAEWVAFEVLAAGAATSLPFVSPRINQAVKRAIFY